MLLWIERQRRLRCMYRPIYVLMADRFVYQDQPGLYQVGIESEGRAGFFGCILSLMATQIHCRQTHISPFKFWIETLDLQIAIACFAQTTFA